VDTSHQVIERGSVLPYYAQLAAILRSGIEAGQWPPGEALPSEAELGSTYGLSRTAVRQALSELVLEGLVQREKGRGTFVREVAVADLVVQEMRGFLDEMEGRGRRVDTLVLRQEVVSVPPNAAPLLGVPKNSDVLAIDRLRSVSGEVVVAVRTHLPLPRFADLVDTNLTGQSLYRLLARTHGVRPTVGRRRIQAIAADDEQAGLLGVEVGAPLLEVNAVGLDQHAHPFEHFVAWYRGDRTSFEIVATEK
jgi:GntR family transcriptional regulator